MAKNLFTLTVKTTTPADSELLVGGTGSANAYNFTWAKLKEWVASFGANNISTTGTMTSGESTINGQANVNVSANNQGIILANSLELDAASTFIYMSGRKTDTTIVTGNIELSHLGGINFRTGGTGSKTAFGSTAIGLSVNRNLSIKDGTADGTEAGQASFYVLSGEMYVKDSGGTQTLLSPHATDAPEWMYDINDPMPPQIDKEMNDFDGIVRYTNNTRKNNLIEMQFSGESLPTGDAAKITFIETYDEHNERTGNDLVMDNWGDFQEREYQNSLDLIKKYEQDKKDFKPTKEVKEFTQIKPEVYVKVLR